MDQTEENSEDLDLIEIIEVIPASSEPNPNLTRPPPIAIKTETETPDTATATATQLEPASNDDSRESLEKLRDELKDHLATLDDK